MTLKNKDGVFHYIDNFVGEKVGRTSLNVLSRLRGSKQEVPVDTGWYANNWQLSVSAPAQGTVGEQPGKGQKIAITEIPASAIAAVSLYNPETMGSIFIVNNVPYARPLNANHSTKAHHVQKIVQDEVDKL